MKLENLDRAKQIANEIRSIRERLSILNKGFEVHHHDISLDFSAPGHCLKTFHVTDKSVITMLATYIKHAYEQQLDDLNAELETL